MNNFENIRKHLDFSNPDYFYLVSLIGRKKDGWDTDVTIMSFKIDSLAKFDLYKDRIIAISTSTHTRAYISASPKSKRGVAALMLRKVVDLFTEEQYGAMDHAYDSAADSNEVEKQFIIDADEQLHINTLYDIKKYLTENNITFWVNPSVTGIHYITKPFDVQKFKLVFPNIDIKKRAKTILYYNRY